MACILKGITQFYLHTLHSSANGRNVLYHTVAHKEIKKLFKSIKRFITTITEQV